MRRWPLHPAPQQGEALSSWFAHIARTYGFSPAEFARQELSIAVKPLDLDGRPTGALFEALHQRSGFPVDQLRKHSVEGIGRIFAADSPGVGSVLIPPSMRTIFAWDIYPKWHFRHLVERECRGCISQNIRARIPLHWQLPISGACLTHRIFLTNRNAWDWNHAKPKPRGIGVRAKPIDTAFLTFQENLESALRGQDIILLNSTVSSSIWLSGVHRLLQELTLKSLVLQIPPHSREPIGLSEADVARLRSAHSMMKFERHHPDDQLRAAKSVASIIGLIGRGRITPPGSGLFVDAIRGEPEKDPRLHVALTYWEPRNIDDDISRPYKFRDEHTPLIKEDSEDRRTVDR